MNQHYPIIPIHNLLADHPSLRFPEVRAAAAAAALRSVDDLHRPPFAPWKPHYDLLDWLALFFGFHLSNAQMRLTPPPDNIDTLNLSVLRRFRPLSVEKLALPPLTGGLPSSLSALHKEAIPSFDLK